MIRTFLGALSLLLALWTHQAIAQQARPPGASVDHAKRVPLPPFRKGEPYAAVRERLDHLGWHKTVKKTTDADTCLPGDGRCEKWPDEMQTCSGTAEANCNFRWAKGGTIIDGDTIKDPPVVTRIARCRSMCR